MTRAVDRRHSVTVEGMNTWRVSWVGSGWKGYTVHLRNDAPASRDKRGWLRVAWFSVWPDVLTYLDGVDVLDMRPLRERHDRAREAVRAEAAA